ncbi:hypothetical protein L4D06_21775 [Enterovibrio makurazakiensis]|uniref:Uncharacterized protein n=1 Tax=Enterovibrio gelatinilyticus TaxID=2899819 RepID=A0ABT5QY59_9GAMM|nr:hypothetical protein [Enterovibrio sp. ZSDZ42]MDD1792222.1 hypothetical protein [Enterovibrio sp. ZSDZ42]
MALRDKFNSGSLISMMAIAIACVVVALSVRHHTLSNESDLYSYLQALPSVALEMVKAQNSLEASDGQVLIASQIKLLQTSFGKLLANQSSGFNQQRLAMKIEILRSSQLEGGVREVHRFGVFNCEPNEQLSAQVATLRTSTPERLEFYPQYQATLCYLDRDGTIFRSSKSSLDK